MIRWRPSAGGSPYETLMRDDYPLAHVGLFGATWDAWLYEGTFASHGHATVDDAKRSAEQMALTWLCERAAMWTGRADELEAWTRRDPATLANRAT